VAEAGGPEINAQGLWQLQVAAREGIRTEHGLRDSTASVMEESMMPGWKGQSTCCLLVKMGKVLLAQVHVPRWPFWLALPSHQLATLTEHRG
jgi:hypothetical protein